MPASRLLPSAAVLGVATLLLSACAGSAGSTEDEGSSADPGGTLSVVTSTDVYADLVQEILGESAEVTALVDNPAADPHSYEATPQDRLTVDGADVIVANGGGYDPFLTRLAATSGKDDAVYQLIEGENAHIHAEDEHAEDEHAEDEHAEDEHEGEEDVHEGHDHAAEDESGGFVNEHIWYDLAAMSDFAEDFSAHMAEISPENAELYADNAAALAEEIDALDDRNRAIEAEGMSFLATEAVSQFLLTDAGFEDATDQQFLAAVEHGDDVSARLYQQALNAAADQEIDLLSYNPQTETNQSAQIREAAEGADVAVLDFNETIPEEHGSYLEWMEANIEAVETVVEESRG
ncbi:zinc ABC transporter substrate-binding protein [Nesterenkonia sp. E16_7]|uniref:metal ABC transporter substrate-binding protein n=1 Tax=unclassified Nesterenkonia TaxID=2629769 RepID=UPI001A9203D7|nr:MULTISPECIES: zinc ABC transporter substrate-binding protein [unclassified Nesterenkonia]MBO0595083.1 zinc ABC transporter substrate-binding protein [Nesterenkonia sp. E16_10]MBO0598738.1 zinc ABC transporter substrate-binding protein [Nesterenkonia sp. E16_7]